MSKWLSDKAIKKERARTMNYKPGMGFIYSLCDQAREANRLRNILDSHGICFSCTQMYVHALDEPFASCLCGTSEWYDFTPYMELQAEINRLRVGLEELERFARRKSVGTVDSAHAIAERIRELLEVV